MGHVKSYSGIRLAAPAICRGLWGGGVFKLLTSGRQGRILANCSTMEPWHFTLMGKEQRSGVFGEAEVL
ncbi:hypothetical protein N7466_003494 [Penicillium verhagenii]|uniref:uncharacterized protein n=1 Tax=Penicillium verhagenii TaxID=1562060 RepID=UPI0025457CC3|nr:uncharacterized protein N7466_003494 [Penicillium verhagenii]KAJ5937044.1 hypothetical protein N7466_003494 [Penicillium verhagenii]